MTSTNAELARSWFIEMWGNKDVDLLRRLLSPQVRGFTEPGFVDSAERFVEMVFIPFTTGFPDLAFEIEGLVDAGDEIVLRWQMRGTHLGELFGIPATRHRVSFRGMTWLRFAHGQIVEGQDGWNQSGLFAALQSGSAQGSVTLIS
jgi:predicted ester cyclase